MTTTTTSQSHHPQLLKASSIPLKHIIDIHCRLLTALTRGRMNHFSVIHYIRNHIDKGVSPRHML